jgi:hypothetical protein
MFTTTNRVARCSRKPASITFFLLLLLIGSTVTAQTYIPGSIVRAATDNTSNGYLDPNGDGYTSSTTAGFPGNNDVSASNNELAYQPVYPFYSEPNSDLRRGPNSRFSDYVPSPIDKASYYLYFDATNSRIYFRVRMGGIVPGAKGFTFLFDTDGKIGNSGVLADPNYKAATTGIGGNPGFEYEVDLYTQNGSTSTGIAVYNVDGQDSRGSFTQLYSVTDWTKYSQISMAATTDSGDPDYYIDFYIPLSAFGGAITSASSLRIIPTTIMAPLPAIGGPKSDIYGLPDNNYADYMSEYINMVAGTPGYSFSQFASGGTGMPNSMPCTAPPTLTGVKSSTVATTTTLTFSGSWTPLNLFTTSTTTTQADLSSISIKVYQTTGNVLLASTTISGTTKRRHYLEPDLFRLQLHLQRYLLRGSPGAERECLLPEHGQDGNGSLRLCRIGAADRCYLRLRHRRLCQGLHDTQQAQGLVGNCIFRFILQRIELVQLRTVGTPDNGKHQRYR